MFPSILEFDFHPIFGLFMDILAQINYFGIGARIKPIMGSSHNTEQLLFFKFPSILQLKFDRFFFDQSR